MAAPNPSPEPEPERLTERNPPGPRASRTASESIRADAYTALPQDARRRRRWPIWVALAAALACGIVLARRSATPASTPASASQAMPR